MTLETLPTRTVQDRINDRLRRVLEIHLHPQGGSAYWLERQRQLGFDALEAVHHVEDLDKLGWTDPHELAHRPLLDFVPRSHHRDRRDWILGQTGGTTGQPAWTAYTKSEFIEAFVDPFRIAAEHVRFPRGQTWLYVGPSGPHIIARAAVHLAHSTDSAEPFTVDFDPRWARKLTAGSFAARRYLDHVVDQAIDVVACQDIGVLFTTPTVLELLAMRMTDRQRDQIRGVHYGGMRLSSERLEQFQTDAFPNAVHLSGYGNTLFGCCLELDVSPGRNPSYFPLGDRLLFGIVQQEESPRNESNSEGLSADRGQLTFSRLDETILLINAKETDAAQIVAPPADAPQGFMLCGIREPHPMAQRTSEIAVGLY